MPKIRIGLSTDFNLRSEKVGIGTTNPSSQLDVAGQILTDNTTGGSGVSTFKEYQGFAQINAEIDNDRTIDNGDCGPFSSLTGIIKITGDVTVSSGSTIEAGKTKTLTVTDKFAVPLGNTNTRDNTPEVGTTRFNSDTSSLEFFNGIEWKSVNSFCEPSGSSRGFHTGGAVDYPASLQTKSIEVINIQSTGGSTLFGELTVTYSYHGTCSSRTRGVVAGNNSPATNVVEYFSLASGGTGLDFGDQASQRYGIGACASSTRGLWGGGWDGANSNVIDYIEIASKSDALDFGDLTAVRRYAGALSSPTRGVWMGGIDNSNIGVTIDYITIASFGSASDFGDCSGKSHQHAACGNSVRGVGTCSANLAGDNTQIQSIQIATTGNAQNFGDLSYSTYVQPGFSCDHTRAVHGGGFTEAPGVASRKELSLINMSSGGLAEDFGSLAVARSIYSACSDSHGGLGGF